MDEAPPATETDAVAEPVEDHLERLLAEAETTLTRLRRELEGVRIRRLSEEEQLAQHAEIEQLRAHLSSAEVQWSEVRGFFESALAELNTRRRSDDPDPSSPASGGAS